MINKLIEVTIACASMTVLAGQTPNAIRMATVEDVAGVKTDVSAPRASFDGWQKFSGGIGPVGCLSLTLPDYELAIPIDRVISIVVSGKVGEVVFDWRGQQRTLSGTLKGSLAGKSDFGDFTLAADKIKSVAFKSPPSNQGAAGSDQSGTLFLENGHQIQLAAIRRHDSYYSTAGYVIGGSTRYSHYDDILFMRGESIVTVKFEDLQKLEFDAAGAVTVTLKNGNTATGKLATGAGAGLEGWTGEADGFVFVAPESVRAVIFGSAPEK